MSSARHRIEAYDEGAHTITLSLRIYITDDSDYGAYRCVASNALGRDDGITYLDGIYCIHSLSHSTTATRLYSVTVRQLYGTLIRSYT